MRLLPAERLAVLAIMMSFISGYALAADHANLFAKPPRGGDPSVQVPVPSQSLLSLVVKIPYDAIDKFADGKIPASMPIGNKGEICVSVPHVNPGIKGTHTDCHKVFGKKICVGYPVIGKPSIGQGKACAGYNWNADIAKSAPFTAMRSGTTVEVRQPVHISGRAGIRGALADLLSLRSKSFVADLTPRLDLAVALDNNWCPQVTATPGPDWVDDAAVEIVGQNCIGINLGPLGHPKVCAGPVQLRLRDELNKEFNKRRPAIQSAIANALPCDMVRGKITPLWRPLSTKMEPLKGDVLYFNLVPTGAAFSGLVAEDDGIKFALQLAAQTSVGPNAIATDPLPLPQLGKLDNGSSALNLNLGLSVPYDVISQEIAKNLVGKEFVQHVSLGDVKVRVKGVDVYPSDMSLVVGLNIDADLPGGLLNTSGWVYVVGRPIVEKGNIVRIDDLHYSTVLNSGFWNMAQSLFDSQIKQALATYSKVDLSKQSDEATQKIVDQLSALSLPGLKLHPQKPTLTLNSVTVGADSLSAIIGATMAFELEVSLEALIK